MLGLHGRGDMEFLRDDLVGVDWMPQRQGRTEKTIQQLELLIFPVEIGLNRFHDGRSSVASRNQRAGDSLGPMIVQVGLQLVRNPSLRDKAKADFALRDRSQAECIAL
jgi:hypothetical protein